MATTMMAPMSSTIAAAVRNMRSSTGTRAPMTAISATANAVSVAMGTPQPKAQGPLGTNDTYKSGHDHAAHRGRDGQGCAAPRGEMPYRELAFYLEAHDEENTVSNASLTQCSSGMLNAASPKPRDRKSPRNA